MLTCAEEIFPGRVVMLDANLFDVNRCATGSASIRSHFCLCLETTPVRVCWLPINSGSSPGRLPILPQEKRGHPNWVYNPKKKDSNGLSYFHPCQVWSLTPQTSCLASRHDLSTRDAPNLVLAGCLARILSDCSQALRLARGLEPV